MVIERNIKIYGEVIRAKPTENPISVNIGSLKFLDSYRFLDAILDKLPTQLTSFPFLDASGEKSDVLKNKLAYPYEKGETIDSFFKPLKTARQECFSTLKQSYPDFEETMRTQALVIKEYQNWKN